ncbi:MAG: DUF3592 domain-containing protein [Gemmatimonadota bacterium]
MPAIALKDKRWIYTSVLGGGLLFLLGIRDLGASYSATLWPFTPGRVVRAAAVASATGEHYPLIEYEYILGGRVHRSSRIQNSIGIFRLWPRQIHSRAEADSATAKYPVGREMRVAYNPGDTDQAWLEPRVNWFALIPLLAGVVFIVGGLVVSRRSSTGNRQTGENQLRTGE